jgi:hypothetical protein
VEIAETSVVGSIVTGAGMISGSLFVSRTVKGGR